MPSVSVKDVSQQAFTVALAAHFKKTGKMKVPESCRVVLLHGATSGDDCEWLLELA